MGIVFVPFFLGLVALFYHAKLCWAWGLMWTGLFGLMVVTRKRRASGRWGSSLRWQRSSLGLYKHYSFQSVFGQAKTFDGLAGGGV